MNRKQTTKKSKTTLRKKAKKGEAKPKPETNPADVRKEVADLVKAHATEMARAVIDEGNKGQLAPVKFLFEVANIYPPAQDGTQATAEEDCLARILLDRLKLAAAPAEKTCETASEGAEESSEPTAKGEATQNPGQEGERDDSEGEKTPEGEPEAEKELLA